MAKSGGIKRRPQGCSLRSHRLRRLKPLTPTLSPATHSAIPSMLPCCTSDLKRRCEFRSRQNGIRSSRNISGDGRRAAEMEGCGSNKRARPSCDRPSALDQRNCLAILLNAIPAAFLTGVRTRKGDCGRRRIVRPRAQNARRKLTSVKLVRRYPAGLTVRVARIRRDN